MSLGPLICAAGTLLMLPIDVDASYLADVLPGVMVLGLGLSLLVAPLTSTVLAAVGDRHAGVASGVNNAVARAAALIAVAALPVVAGLSGDDYTQPTAFSAGFRTAMLGIAGLLVLGAVLAAATIRNEAPAVAAASRPAREPVPAGVRAERSPRWYCAVEGPPPDASAEQSMAPVRDQRRPGQ
jgi:hypothetical protein